MTHQPALTTHSSEAWSFTSAVPKHRTLLTDSGARPRLHPPFFTVLAELEATIGRSRGELRSLCCVGDFPAIRRDVKMVRHRVLKLSCDGDPVIEDDLDVLPSQVAADDALRRNGRHVRRIGEGGAAARQ